MGFSYVGGALAAWEPIIIDSGAVINTFRVFVTFISLKVTPPRNVRAPRLGPAAT
jgi:hypothetical protein